MALNLVPDAIGIPEIPMRLVVTDLTRDGSPPKFVTSRYDAAIFVIRGRYGSTRIERATLYGTNAFGEQPIAFLQPHQTEVAIAECFLEAELQQGHILLETEAEWRGRLAQPRRDPA